MLIDGDEASTNRPSPGDISCVLGAAVLWQNSGEIAAWGGVFMIH